MTSFVELDGRRLAYETWGDPGGLPVFTLHGTPGSRLQRWPDDEALATTGARVITYDRPGYGSSDRHEGRAVVDCVADVVAIADDLGVDRFALTGTSGGGPQGLDWLAGMDEENVKEFGWTLAGADVLAGELRREADGIVSRVAEDPATMLGDFDLPEADRAALQHPLQQQSIRESTADMFSHGMWGWVDDDLAFARPWGFDVDTITVPVEVLYGAHDVMVPAAHGAWLGRHVPGAEVTVRHPVTG